MLEKKLAFNSEFFFIMLLYSLLILFSPTHNLLCMFASKSIDLTLLIPFLKVFILKSVSLMPSKNELSFSLFSIHSFFV